MHYGTTEFDFHHAQWDHRWGHADFLTTGFW